MNRIVAVLAAVLACCATPALAETKFDLQVTLRLAPDDEALLRAGDTVRVVLRPVKRFGATQVAAVPVAVERTYAPGALEAPLALPAALAADQVYSVEVQIVRAGGAQARYLSALARLPRRAVDRPLPARLFRRDGRDRRENLLVIVRDGDGVYRVQMFAA